MAGLPSHVVQVDQVGEGARLVVACDSGRGGAVSKKGKEAYQSCMSESDNAGDKDVQEIVKQVRRTYNDENHIRHRGNQKDPNCCVVVKLGFVTWRSKKYP
jgi:hypothetical protein